MRQVYDKIQSKLKLFNKRFIVTLDDIKKAVSRMKAGKHEGNGLFSSDCIKNAPESLLVHLSLLISAMFTHGFVLDELTISTIVPIPKPKLDACISNNYRSIASCSIIGKLIDFVLFYLMNE